jgi:hypothetical protein
MSTDVWPSSAVVKTLRFLARRDRRVAFDQLREHAAERFEAERERGHVEQHDVAHFTGEHAGLDRGADGDDFVGVDRLVESLYRSAS